MTTSAHVLVQELDLAAVHLGTPGASSKLSSGISLAGAAQPTRWPAGFWCQAAALPGLPAGQMPDG